MGGSKSKRKGNKYERELVARCDELGLPAERRYGNRECDDVLVGEGTRVECKYRASGSGFKRLYDWLAGSTNLLVRQHHPDVFDGYYTDTLHVMTLEAWADALLSPARDGCDWDFSNTRDSKADWATLRRWCGGADYLAVRMARRGWLMVEVL